MILNPVIQGGTEEKVYKITDKTGGSFPASAKAGEFVSPNEPNAPNSIKTQSGKIVPFRSVPNLETSILSCRQRM